MTKRVVVDPITRIEGHLRIEVIVDENNVIQDAFSTSTLWRGLEKIVQGRDPRDVAFIVQRICGVCTFSHYKAGTVAVENALGITPPLNAILTRTLMNIALFLHDHPVHFYTLHGLDWCDIVSALSADERKASELAFKYTSHPIYTGTDELKVVKEKVKKFVEQGQLGPFNNAYWGHKTYRFTPEQNLIVVSHYLKLLEIQRVVAQMMAIFGAKQPHPQSLTVGGITSVMDLQDPSRLGEWLTKYNEVREFVNRAYWADIIMAAEMYKTEDSVLKGCGLKNFLSFQEMQVGANEWLLSSGIVRGGDLSKVEEVDESKIAEDATHSWYADDGFLHPYDGKTNPKYTGFRDGEAIGIDGKPEKTKLIDEKGKYSWIKSPRYDGEPMEVGPLASIVVSYAKGNKYVVPVVNELLEKTGLTPAHLFSTLGRTAGRAIEAKVIADNGIIAFNNLVENLKTDKQTCVTYTIDKNKTYRGRYIGNVPRGMLSHWVSIENGVVKNYQAVVPSTWNAGPADANGKKGPYEMSLIGTKLQDITQPLEIVRHIHSFDPCIACAVHVMDTNGNELSEYKIEPSVSALR